jgi:hypothetical protein
MGQSFPTTNRIRNAHRGLQAGFRPGLVRATSGTLPHALGGCRACSPPCGGGAGLSGACLPPRGVRRSPCGLTRHRTRPGSPCRAIRSPVAVSGSLRGSCQSTVAGVPTSGLRGTAAGSRPEGRKWWLVNGGPSELNFACPCLEILVVF